MNTVLLYGTLSMIAGDALKRSFRGIRITLHLQSQLLLYFMVTRGQLSCIWSTLDWQVVGTHDASNPLKESLGKPILTCDVSLRLIRTVVDASLMYADSYSLGACLLLTSS